MVRGRFLGKKLMALNYFISISPLITPLVLKPLFRGHVRFTGIFSSFHGDLILRYKYGRKYKIHHYQLCDSFLSRRYDVNKVVRI